MKSAAEKERERDRRVSSGGAFFRSSALERADESGIYLRLSLSLGVCVFVSPSSLTRERQVEEAPFERASERSDEQQREGEGEEDESGEKGRNVGVSTPGGRLPANDAGPIKRARFVTVQSAATCDQHLRRIAVCAGKMGCAASRRGRPT